VAGPGAPEGKSILVRAPGGVPRDGRVRAWIVLAEEAQRNRGGPHPCEGTGGWPQRPGDGMGYPGNGSFAKSGSRLPDVGDPSRGLLAGLGPGGGPHPCEGTGGWPQRPGDGMGCPGGGSLLSPSLGRPALAVRVAACLLDWASGEGPILVRALGGGPSGRVTAWVVRVAEAC
jgi:hypothetical protein